MRRISLLFTLAISVSMIASQQSHAQWVQTSAPHSAYIFCFAFSDSITFAGSGGGLLMSRDQGLSWRTADSGLANTYAVLSCLVLDSTTILVGTDLQGVFRSTDNGTSWKAANAGLTNTEVDALAKSDSNIFAGTLDLPGGVFLSTNSGTSWTAVNSGLSNTGTSALAVSGPNLFAGTLGGGVFLSTNNGTSWKPVNNGLTDLVVWSLAIVDSNIFAGTGTGGIFLSTDNGSGWNAVNTGLTNMNVQSIVPVGTWIFVGIYDGGVFFSGDTGAHWLSMNEGLGDVEVNALGINSGLIYAGTYGGGVWTRKVEGPVGVVRQPPSQSLLRFSLNQNYSNPFNPTSTISYSLPQKSFVTLKLYDLLGRELRTLVSGEQGPGNYTRMVDANGLPSGVYFYRLQAGNPSASSGHGFTDIKKMLLLK